jgi:hypothetical protein
MTVQEYYPAIVDEATFHKVQKSLKAGTTGGKTSNRTGRKGNFSNLFTTVNVCGYCNSRMAIIDAGARYGADRMKLVFDTGRRGAGCKYSRLSYSLIEQSVLSYCSEVDLSQLLDPDTGDELIMAKDRLQGLRDMVAAIEAKIEAELSLSAMVSAEVCRSGSQSG